MALYKRGIFWWIDFTDGDGGRIQRSLKTTVKKDAQQLRDRLVNDRWKVKELGKKQRRTWEETVVRWVTEKHLKKRLIFHDLGILMHILGIGF